MTAQRPQVAVTGGFDDLKSRHIRFLEEAAKLGNLTVFLWSDNVLRQRTGRSPLFPQDERRYLLQGIRFVQNIKWITHPEAAHTLSEFDEITPQAWVVETADDTPEKKAFCKTHRLKYHVLRNENLRGFAEPPPPPSDSGHKKVIATGCYDWFHSGHVRFFEEVSAYGDLYVVVGHDANIRLLKGDGHPLLPQDERRYTVGSVRFVKQALISTGNGWLDAEPEIQRLKPDIYAVNEDGDRREKRAYCEQHGIQYLVLKRTPAPGLPRRSSTDLRGF
jgi:cytidyltransferase-like protein